MKTLGKSLFGATAATALALASATPAQARDGHGIDTGDVIAGALILGGIAAIAVAASDNDHDRYDGAYNGRYDDGRYDRDNRGYGQYRGGYGNQQQAVQMCSTAAVRDASRYGRGARVTQITDVDSDRNGYEVEGRLVVNDNSRWNRGRRDLDEGRFTCRIRYGRIESLRVRGLG